jgi:LysM repeat protein
MPALTINLPLALLLIVVFIAIGAGLVYYALQETGQVVEPTQTPTVTLTTTPTITHTPVTPTPTHTQVPSPTPLTYTVASGDTCSSIAFSFGVSIQSIVLLNNLPAACDTLFVSQTLLIPHPTPTATALPTATLSGAEATREACGEVEYLVQENDTLSSISANYNISITALKEYNGLVNDTVRSGQSIIIPLCERIATPGPTPTPTPPPPYPAANLLLPPDGAPFSFADDTITLQWASVGTLRQNEAYVVTLVDVTGGEERRLVDYLIDTKYIIPEEFLPRTEIPHVLRWWVGTARQTGTDDDGNPIWEQAGALSVERVFTWTGTGTAPTPTP